MVEKIAEINRGDYIEPAKMTVKELIDTWLYDEVRHNRKIATFDIYKSITKNHIIPRLGNIPLNNLTTFHIHQFLKSLLNERCISEKCNVYYPHFKSCVKLGR